MSDTTAAAEAAAERADTDEDAFREALDVDARLTAWGLYHDTQTLATAWREERARRTAAEQQLRTAGIPAGTRAFIRNPWPRLTAGILVPSATVEVAPDAPVRMRTEYTTSLPDIEGRAPIRDTGRRDVFTTHGDIVITTSEPWSEVEHGHDLAAHGFKLA